MNQENLEKAKTIEGLKVDLKELERSLEGKETELASLLQNLEEEKENLQQEMQTVFCIEPVVCCSSTSWGFPCCLKEMHSDAFGLCD